MKPTERIMRLLWARVYKHRRTDALNAVAMAWAVERGDIATLLSVRSCYLTRARWSSLADQSILRLVESIRVASALTRQPAEILYESFMRDLSEREEQTPASALEATLEAMRTNEDRYSTTKL